MSYLPRQRTRKTGTITVSGDDVPIRDTRLLVCHSAGKVERISPDATHHYDEYTTDFLKFVDAWKARYAGGRWPCLTETLSLADSYIAARGPVPMPRESLV